MAAQDIYRQGDRKVKEAFVEPEPVEEVPSLAESRHVVNTITDQRDVAIIKMLIDRSVVTKRGAIAALPHKEELTAS